MTLWTPIWIGLVFIVIVGITMAIWVCIAERWEKKLKQKSVESIIERDRKVIK